jgi:hypothetical protein
MKKRPLEIDMIAGSQLRDSTGETLSLEGADISPLLMGKGLLNDNHGKGFFNSIGRITEAKKIFKEEDCETDRQRYYWDKVKAPFLYVKGNLHDDEDHPNAKAAAAILRNIHKNDCPLQIKASVEGGVIARGIKDPTLLARTKIHSVALTFTPANHATLVEPVSLEKTAMTAEDEALIKSVIPLAKSDVPSFRHVTRKISADKITDNLDKIKALSEQLNLKTQYPSVDSDTLVKAALEQKIHDNIVKINEIVRAMVAHLDVPAITTPSTEKVAKNIEQILDLIKGEVIKLPPAHTKIKPGKSFDLGEGKKATLLDREHRDDAHRDHWILSHPDAKDPVHAYVANFPNKSGSFDSVVQSVRPYSQEQLEDFIELGVGHENDDLHHEMEKTYAHGIGKHFASHFKSTYPNLHAEEGEDGMFKALTAGYGGAGSPMSLTGGGVLQSEKLEIKPTKDRYISCSECGDKQVYVQHQVKCRQCQKNFPMSSLSKYMIVDN